MHEILLIGAGQLGSRHLQALANCDFGAVALRVVDPSPEALAAARERFSQVQAAPQVREVTFHDSLAAVAPAVIDFCVVATGANCRLVVLRELLARRQVRNLVLEKVLFQSVAQLDEAAALLATHEVRTWVNCPRRQLPGYRLLRERLADAGDINLQVSGSNWGLACNAIHFIDLWSFIGGHQRYELALDGLVASIPSKRSGYREVTGTLAGRDGDAGFMLTVSADTHPAAVHIRIETAHHVVSVEEGAGRCTITRNADGQVEELPFPMLFQSQLTHRVARAALLGEAVPLTPFAESAALHRPLLEGLLDFFRRHDDASLAVCPIT